MSKLERDLSVHPANWGQGILSQGEIILNPEQHRLIAKRAWLQLFEYLAMNDETIKSLQVPVPHSLENDRDINAELQAGHQSLERFQSLAHYKLYLKQSEAHYNDVDITANHAAKVACPREQWIIAQTKTFNPLTVLDVGCGFGEIAIELSRKPYSFQVTGLVPNDVTVNAWKETIETEGLPVEFRNVIFEEIDFEDRQFDVVLLGEILEHVANDYSFLLKAMGLAKKAVIITTPWGSVEGGFIANAAWAEQNEHVRAYSEESFERLLKKVVGESDGKITVFKAIRSMTGYRGQPINCLCAVLTKEDVHAPRDRDGQGGDSPEGFRPRVEHSVLTEPGDSSSLHQQEERLHSVEVDADSHE